MSATRGTQQTAKMKLVREKEELAKQAKRNESKKKERRRSYIL